MIQKIIMYKVNDKLFNTQKNAIQFMVQEDMHKNKLNYSIKILQIKREIILIKQQNFTSIKIILWISISVTVMDCIHQNVLFI